MVGTDFIHNCAFCVEFECKYFEFHDRNFGSRIVWETENFVVFPAVDELVDGYLLIATKRHFIGMGEIPSNFYIELDSVQKRVRDVLGKNYEAPIFFEHGPATVSRRGGCCIDHAHMHAVPGNIGMLKSLQRRFTCREMNSYDDIKYKFNRGEPYFFIEENNGKRYVVDIPPIMPSQYLRQIVAREINQPDKWDWRRYPGLKRLERTILKLRDEFPP